MNNHSLTAKTCCVVICPLEAYKQFGRLNTYRHKSKAQFPTNS